MDMACFDRVLSFLEVQDKSAFLPLTVLKVNCALHSLFLEIVPRFGPFPTSLLSGGAAGILLFFCAAPLAAIFSPDPDVIELAADMLRIVAISEPLFGLSIVLSGVMRGAGNTRLPFLVVLSGMWGVRIILTPVLLFCAHMELAGVWVAMIADLMFRGILCEIQTKRLLSKLEAVCNS